MPYKQSGLVSLYSPECEFNYTKIDPSPEGCYWQAETTAENSAEYILTALPFYRGRYPQRYLVKYTIQTDENGVYSVLANSPRTIRNKGVKNQRVCSFKINENQLKFIN